MLNGKDFIAWLIRADECRANGEKVIAAVLCIKCGGWIPRFGANPTWLDVKCCECGEFSTLDELEKAIGIPVGGVNPPNSRRMD